MLFEISPGLAWGLAAAHLLGIVCALASRVNQGSPEPCICRWLFLLCLLLVGASAGLTISSPSGIWIYSGVTLTVMIVATTYDVRRAAEASVY